MCWKFLWPSYLNWMSNDGAILFLSWKTHEPPFSPLLQLMLKITRPWKNSTSFNFNVVRLFPESMKLCFSQAKIKAVEGHSKTIGNKCLHVLGICQYIVPPYHLQKPRSSIQWFWQARIFPLVKLYSFLLKIAEFFVKM